MVEYVNWSSLGIILWNLTPIWVSLIFLTILWKIEKRIILYIIKKHLKKLSSVTNIAKKEFTRGFTLNNIVIKIMSSYLVFTNKLCFDNKIRKEVYKIRLIIVIFVLIFLFSLYLVGYF